MYAIGQCHVATGIACEVMRMYSTCTMAHVSMYMYIYKYLCCCSREKLQAARIRG